MLRAINNNSYSYMRRVNTSVGTFTIHFPHGVMKGDPIEKIVDFITNFQFRLAPENASINQLSLIRDVNASTLQQELNKFVCFGASSPSYGVDVLWGKREINLI